MSIFKIHFKRIDRTVEIDESRFPDHVVQHNHEYGWRQKLADAYASAKTDSEANAMFDQRMDMLLAGDLRATRESDPVAKRAREIAVTMTNKELGAYTAKSPKDFVTKWKSRVAEIAANPKVVAMAESQVAALAEIEL